MSVSAEASSSDDAGGNAMVTAAPTTGVDPFAPRPSGAAPRGFAARLLDYGAHAAMIVGLLGFAWTVGGHVIHRPGPVAEAPTQVAAAAPPGDPLAELRKTNRDLAASVHALQARLDALQANVGEDGKVAAQVRVLQAGLDNVKAGIGAARSEQTAAVTRLDGKIDKLAHEPTSKMQQLVDRLGRLERAPVDPTPTASLPRPADARPMPRPAGARTEVKEAKAPESRPAGIEEPAKPQVLSNWVVRDVYQGVALIEGRRGTLEVVPGVGIPGAGVVKSIDRAGSGWKVVTTKGVVAFAAAPRPYRRADRGYYPAGGYYFDF